MFMGSAKYPTENAYKDYINKNGGSYNGGTSMDTTTYMFTVNSQAFNNTLDIFSQFFKSPLFQPDSLSREVQAIDSEDSKNRILDNRRTLQVLKSLMYNDTTYSKFSTGNLQTLVQSDVNVYIPPLAREMRRFHATYYKPENMAVVLVGPQSLSELEALLISHFSTVEAIGLDDDVPSSDDSLLSSSVDSTSYNIAQSHESMSSPVEGALIPLIKPSTSFQADESKYLDMVAKHGLTYPFTTSAAVIRMKPVKDTNEMNILWPLPPTRAFYRTDPSYLITYLLTHKASNHSIYSFLQRHNLGSAISGGIRTEHEDFSVYQLSLRLTAEGLRRYDEIIALIYRNINLIEVNLLGNKAYLTDIWRDLRDASAIDFRYQDRFSGYDISQSLVYNMIRYPSEHVFSAGAVLDEDFDSDLCTTLLRDFTPERGLVLLKSSEYTWLPQDLPNVNVSEAISVNGHMSSSSLHVDYPAAATVTESLQPNRIEKYYGVHYRLDPVDDDTIQTWHTARHTSPSSSAASSEASTAASWQLRLPVLNAYISHELLTRALQSPPSLLKANIASEPDLLASNRYHSPYPEQIALIKGHNSDLLITPTYSLWHSKDALFYLPKSIILVYISTPYCGDGSPVNGAVSALYSQMMADKYVDILIILLVNTTVMCSYYPVLTTY